MKTHINKIFGITLTIVLCLCLYNLWQFKKLDTSTVSTSQSNSKVFDRVIESGEIRVGYLVLAPYLNKNTATGDLSGIFYDFMEEMGRRLQLKIVWVEEVNLATLSEGIDNNRYDMIAFPLWRSSERVKKVAFSVPLFYSTVGCYVRADDTRFDNNLNAINAPDVLISTIDGELAESIAKSDYPEASLLPLPPLADYSQMLLQISTKKADVTFYNRVFAKRYMDQNPGTIKEVPGPPVRVFAECYIMPHDDFQFQEMINATILELIENGYLNQAFKNNGENPNEYYMTAPPYGLSK